MWPASLAGWSEKNMVDGDINVSLPWLSESGRQVLSTEMFGDAFAADEAFGHTAV